MADETSILRVAEAELHHIHRLLADHLQANPDGCRWNCGTCEGLYAHIGRAEHQVELLTPAPAEEVALW